MMKGRTIWRGLAGHSHYHNVRHRKARVDAKRQSVFQKLSQEIYASIKAGGSSDPKKNGRLGRAIEAARRGSMPKERIERALRTGSRTASQGSVVFEGVFPGGVGVLVRASSGRRNAVAGEIRGLFRRAGGEMGRAGWMFSEKQVVVVPATRGSDGEEVALFGMEQGAEEVEISDECVEVICDDKAERDRIRKGLVELYGYDEAYGVRRMEARRRVQLDGERGGQLWRLFEDLDEHEEVVEVVHNADVRQV